MLVRVRGTFQGVATGNGTVEYPFSYRDGAKIAGGAFKFKIVGGQIKAEDGVSDLVVLGAAVGQANPPSLKLIAVPTLPGKPFVIEFLPVPNAASQGADVVDVNLPPADVAVVLPRTELESLASAKNNANAAAGEARAAKTEALTAALGANTAAGYAQGVGDQVAAVGRQLPAPPVLDDAAKNVYFAGHPGNGVSVLVWATGHLWQRVNGVVTDLGGAVGGAGAQGLKTVATTGSLSAMAAPVLGDVVNVRGAAADGDGGGGLWAWVRGARPARNGVLTEYHQTDTTGYFSRIWDGARADLAWAGLAAGAGAAALVTALSVLAGTFVTVDKAYTLASAVEIPANTRLYGKPGAGFTANAGNPNALIANPGVSINDLLLDGSTAPVRNNAFNTNGLIVSRSTLANPVSVNNVRALNSRDHVVYGFGAPGTRVTNLRVDGCGSEAVYFQLSDALYIDGVFTRNCHHDAVKIHSKDGQAQNLNFEIKTLTIANLFLDYSMVTTTGDVLALEMWGGQTGFIRNAVVTNVQVKSPAALNGGAFWGISADTCASGSVRGFTVDGEKRGTITFGIEAAGCVDFTYDTGSVIGYKYIGLSMSQPATKNTKARNVTFRDAVLSPNGDTYAVQWFNNIKGGEVINCTFKDAGHRYLFWNSAGDGALVQGNHFLVGAQTVTPNILYVSGSPRNVRIFDNEFAPSVWPGDTASTTSYAKGGEIVGALGWLIRGNSFSALRPDGTYGANSFPSLIGYGGGGGHRIQDNVGYDFTTPFLGQFNDGPSSTFIHNFIYASTVAAQDARATDVIITGTGGGSGSAAALTMLRPQTITAISKPDRKPMINVSFDDCFINDYTDAYPILTQKGIKANFGLVGSFIGQGNAADNAPHMSVAQILELQAAGHEMSCHTSDHTDLTTMNSGQLDTYLKASLDGLTALGIKNVTNLIYPYNAHNAAVRYSARKFFSSALAGGSTISAPPLLTFALQRREFDPNGTAAMYKGWVDEAIAANGVLFILIHSRFPEFAAAQQQNFKDMIDYALSKGVVFGTMSEVLAVHGNAMDFGDLPGGEYGGGFDRGGRPFSVGGSAGVTTLAASNFKTAAAGPLLYDAGKITVFDVNPGNGWPGSGVGTVTVNRIAAAPGHLSGGGNVQWEFVQFKDYYSTTVLERRRSGDGWTAVWEPLTSVHSVLPANSLSGGSVRTAYANGKVTIMPFSNGGPNLWPFAAGTAYTDRTSSEVATGGNTAWDRQTAYDFYSDAFAMRRAVSDVAWTDWVIHDPVIQRLPAESALADGTKPRTAYKNGCITYIPFYGGNSKGLPCDVGTLVIYRNASASAVGSNTMWDRREVFDYNTDNAWRSRATSDTAWSAWFKSNP